MITKENLDKLKEQGYKLEGTTFIKPPKDKDDIEFEIGDIHSDEFQQQVKIKKWDNEVNFSVRLLDQEKKECRFYEVPEVKKVKEEKESDKVRYIKRGEITPESAVAEYELYKHELTASPTITTSFLDKEAILFFGRQEAESYYNLENFELPIVRFNTIFHANPMYADSNLAWLTFHYSTNQFPDNNGIELLQDSIIEALSEYGLEIEKYHGKLFYIKDGIKYKFFSSSITKDRLHCFINFEADYNKSMDLYKSGVEVDTYDPKDSKAKGLCEANPNIKKEILDEIVDIFISKIEKQKKVDSFTKDEEDELQRLEKRAEDEQWRLSGERDDILSNQKDVFEFEVVLKEKPATNKVQMSIETKGLRFCYQPKLTPEAKFRGDNRPFDVIGSYAVYHEDRKKRGDYSKIGGKNYQVGKAFHIYRPKIIDSAGAEVWGDLNIENGILTVEIPQDFLDNAVYPVRHAAGLTFGYYNGGVGGGTTGEITYNGYIRFDTDTGAAGTGNSMSAYVQATEANVSGRMCLYDTSLNKATNGQTDENTNVPTSADWVTLNFTSEPTLTSQTYYLAYWGDGGGPPYNPHTDIYYDDDVGHDNFNDVVAGPYGTFPASIVKDTTYSDKILSIYCTYSAGGAAGPANLKTLDGIAKANIKTIGGIAIANVKSRNGIS